MSRTPDRDRAPGLRTEASTWPPIRRVDVDGWRVGLSGGFTQRGNSVVAVGAPPDPEAAIDRVEALYAEHDQPSVFRVCAESLPTDLDARLAARGYVVVAPTTVMVGSTARRRAPRAPITVTVADLPDRAWCTAWLGVKDSGGVDLDLAQRLVAGSPARYLTAHDDLDNLLGVIRVGLADGWAALSCLAVRPEYRRRAVGRSLTLAALDAAAAHAVDRAFLQVVHANVAAIALYESLGFQAADAYHYRRRER